MPHTHISAADVCLFAAGRLEGRYRFTLTRVYPRADVKGNGDIVAGFAAHKAASS